MEQIIGQILSQYGLYGLMIAGFALFLYRQGQQNIERNRAVERRFDEERKRAAEMENRLLDEFQRSIAEKDREIGSLRDRLTEAEKTGKERETSHLNLQREFDQFKGQAEAQLAQTLRELDQTKALYNEERRNGISLGVNNNRLTADNQSLIKKNNRLSQEKESLNEQVINLETLLIAAKVDLQAMKEKYEAKPILEVETHGADC